MKYTLSIIAFLLLPVLLYTQELTDLDEIAPYSEGLAAVRKGDQWGFIDKHGELVINFRNDLVWNLDANDSKLDITGVRYPQFKNGRCLIRELLKEEEIWVYGFIDTSGNTVIKPEFLNVTQFDQGYVVGIMMTKTFRGKNNFQLNLYQYSFSEVVVDTAGDIMRLISRRDHILMTKRRYKLPLLRAKLVNPELVLVKNDKDKWEILKLDL